MKTTIDMVREAGMLVNTSRDSMDHLERLVALVRADEREECAKVCEDNHEMWRWDNEPDSRSGPRDCADAIRARGNA